MPCSDGRDYPYGPSEQEVRDNHTKTRLACDRCQYLEQHGGVPAWAQEWWNRHKAEDAAREASSARAKREAEIRKRALAKLTPEERDELGV